MVNNADWAANLASIVGGNNNQYTALQNQITALQKQQLPTQSQFQNPFTSAMSGTQSGTLQDYINRLTQQAQQAQGGGLLGIQPQQYQAGNAGGQPMGQLPQMLPQSASMPLSSFGQRSWMK